MALRVSKRKQSENSREYAYRVLRENIMNFWLEPGALLNENELSATFGMSRTPVHEAIISLRDEHLVDVLPQHGSSVSLIDLMLLREGYFMRLSVEPIIITELAGKVGPKDLNTLQEILYKQEAALKSENVINNFFPLDDKFHRQIYAIYNMPHVWDSIKGLSSHFDRVRYLDAMYYKSEYLDHFLEEHRQLYEILMCGAPSGFDLEGFPEKHISSYKKSYLALTEQFPHYFSKL